MTITNDDLLKELSETELSQLSDINGTGTTDQGVIDDAVADALAFIESFFALPQTPTPLLHKIAADLAVYELRRKNGLIGEEEKAQRKEAESYLLRMSKGLLPVESIGGDTPAPAGRKAVYVHTKARMNTAGLGMGE